MKHNGDSAMAKYKIYGDYGYVSECLLHEESDRMEALLWATRYTRGGDLGGYNIIEVAYFDKEEYVPIMSYRQEDYDQEDDDIEVDFYAD
jgi:hypothetical protein